MLFDIYSPGALFHEEIPTIFDQGILLSMKLSKHDEEEFKKGRQISNKVYSRMIGYIFGAIEDKADMTMKRHLLKNLSEKLFYENVGFKKYEYNDAVLILQFILEKLRKEDPNMSYFFEIRSRKWCNCG